MNAETQQKKWNTTRVQDSQKAEWMAHAEKPYTEDSMVLEGIYDRTRSELMQREPDPDYNFKDQALITKEQGIQKAIEASHALANISAEEAAQAFDRREDV